MHKGQDRTTSRRGFDPEREERLHTVVGSPEATDTGAMPAYIPPGSSQDALEGFEVQPEDLMVPPQFEGWRLQPGAGASPRQDQEDPVVWQSETTPAAGSPGARPKHAGAPRKKA